MHVARTTEPSNITIEVRTNVIQLVKNRNQLLFERQIQKSRQQKRQQIERLAPLMNHSLDGPKPTIPPLNNGTTLKA
jgi:hypothetical protein